MRARLDLVLLDGLNGVYKMEDMFNYGSIFFNYGAEYFLLEQW